MSSTVLYYCLYFVYFNLKKVCVSAFVIYMIWSCCFHYSFHAVAIVCLFVGLFIESSFASDWLYLWYYVDFRKPSNVISGLHFPFFSVFQFNIVCAIDMISYFFLLVFLFVWSAFVLWFVDILSISLYFLFSICIYFD